MNATRIRTERSGPLRLNARSPRGMTLIETLVTGLVAIMLGAGLWTLLRSSYDSQYALVNQNAVNAEARATVDVFADHLRGAATITAASASDVTFTDSGGNTYRYWKSGSTLRYTVNGSPTGGAQMQRNLTSLTLTYWTWTGTSWTTSTSPSNLTTIAGVDIAATSSVNGASRSISSTVRFRQIQRF